MSTIATGAHVEWTCGASFFYLRLAHKPSTRGLRAKPLRDLLGAVCAELAKRGVTALTMAPAQGLTALAPAERSRLLQEVRQALESPNRFGFSLHDGVLRRDRAGGAPSDVCAAVHYVLECDDLPVAAGAAMRTGPLWPTGAEWARDTAVLVRALHRGVPNLGSLFAAPGSTKRQLLQAALGEHGLVVAEWDLTTAAVLIVFPSMWAGVVVANAPSVGGVVLRVDKLRL